MHIKYGLIVWSEIYYALVLNESLPHIYTYTYRMWSGDAMVLSCWLALAAARCLILKLSSAIPYPPCLALRLASFSYRPPSVRYHSKRATLEVAINPSLSGSPCFSLFLSQPCVISGIVSCWKIDGIDSFKSINSSLLLYRFAHLQFQLGGANLQLSA